jgi:hypothetical protein
MFESLRLRARIWSIKQQQKALVLKYEQRLADAPDHMENLKLQAAWYAEDKALEDSFSMLQTKRMRSEIEALDMELPQHEIPGVWWHDEDINWFLTAKGRVLLRKLIDEEKTRRFEIWTKWVKLFTPIIVALVAAFVTYVVAYKFHAK